MTVNLGTVFLSELCGTAILVLLGTGAVANVVLSRTKGYKSGWLLISLGWGFGVFAGVSVAAASGAHLNPAVVIGKALARQDYADGVKVSLASTTVYLTAELLGAFLGAVITYLIYKQHFDVEKDGEAKLSVFSTGAQIRSNFWNMVTETLATFVLVFVVLNLPHDIAPGLNAIVVAFLVMGLAMSLGGPTGVAINPARDLGPRIAHAVLPIKDKGSSQWSYSWIPVIGPCIGGGLAGFAFLIVQAMGMAG